MSGVPLETVFVLSRNVSEFMQSYNSITRRRVIQAGQEIGMWRGIFVLLLYVSQTRDSAAVSNGEYRPLLDFVSLFSYNTHQLKTL